MRINIIGAGKLGKTIAYLLTKNQLAQIVGVFNTTAQSTWDAVKFIGAGHYCPSIDTLPHADITFITTPDACLLDVCKIYAHNKHLKPGDIIIHCSGVYSSEVLAILKNKGCYTASIHPMHSFANPAWSITNYQGTYCAMEGDEEALSILKPLFDAIGSITYIINKEKKALYHTAGVFASNYLITLAQQALNCLQNAGVEQDMAFNITTALMQNTLLNLKQAGSPSLALTGPIQRGDTATFQLHMHALTAPLQKKLYALLGQATVPLASIDAQRCFDAGESFQNDGSL